MNVTGHLSGIASLRGRLGIAFDRSLVYATGGVAFAGSNAVGGHTLYFNDRSRIPVGGVVGGGVELMISPSVSVRTEGLYYMFDETQSPNGTASGFAGLDEAWMLRVGSSWHFNQAAISDPVPVDGAFQGYYIGGHMGYGSAEYSGVHSPTGPRQSPEANGFLTGAHIGYNWALMSNIVAGIEGDVTVTPWGGATNETNSTQFVFGHISGIASLRSRVGFVFDRMMAYATGGVAFASTNAGGGYTTQLSDRSKIAAGGVVGGGLEYLTSDNLAIRAEGLYYKFDQSKQSNSFGSGFAGLNDSWMMRVGASYYFNPLSDAGGEPVVADFQGFYVGGHAGYGSAEYSGLDNPGSDFARFDASGYLAGMHVGYNMQAMSNIVAGVEGDISLTPWTGAEDPTDDSEFVSGHLNGIASLRGRLGFQFDRALLYATGGVAIGVSNATGGSTVQFSDRTDLEFAPVVGGGIEYMANDNLALRVEGMHYWFDQKDAGEGHSGFGGIQDTWTMRVGASWYFN